MQTYPAIVVYNLDPTGKPRTRATEIRLFDASATNPTPVTGPDSGDLYFNTTLGMWMSYDGTRSKWLSIETGQLMFGRSGITAAGAYYRGIDRRAYTATIGRAAEFAGTVIGLTYTRTDTSAAVFEAVASGTTIATLASSALSGTDNTLNGDFTVGQILAARNQTGGTSTTNVSGVIRFKWRVV